MSYRIEYDPQKNKRYPIPSARKPGWLVITLAAVVALFALQKLAQKEKMMSWLIPGDSAITSGAFSEMLDNIREGDSVGTAVTAFCREILDNG